MKPFNQTVEEFGAFVHFINSDLDLGKIKKMFQALEEFKQKNPWSGDFDERKEKFTDLHNKFNEIFGRNIGLSIEISPNPRDWSSSGNSYYIQFRDGKEEIHLKGRFSVITFLHEWFHALLGNNEKIARIASWFVFSKIFPEKWEKLKIKSGLARPINGGVEK